MSYLFRIVPLRVIGKSELLNFSRSYAKATSAGIPSLGGKKKLGGKGGPALEKKIMPVETDPKKLATYVCGSCITKEGEDIKLMKDEEYPDWLWNLRLGPPPPIEEIEPDTDLYWKRVRKLARRREVQLLKLKKF